MQKSWVFILKEYNVLMFLRENCILLAWIQIKTQLEYLFVEQNGFYYKVLRLVLGNEVRVPESLSESIQRTRAMPPGEPKLLFLGGSGGTGKTRLLNAIAAKLRLEGKIVLCTAFTGP